MLKQISLSRDEAFAFSVVFDLNNLLQELKRMGKVIHEGSRKSGYRALKEGNYSQRLK